MNKFKTDKIYSIWSGIQQRCCNPNHKNYKDYGGRGITICDEWLNNPDKFKEWAYANGYKIEKTKSGVNKWSIDRIDNNKGYSPENCRWVTKTQQNRNKRTSAYVLFNGKERPVKEVAEELGINYYTLIERLKNENWTVDMSISLKPKEKVWQLSNSGHKYIYKDKYGYKVIINKVYIGHPENLECAIKLRNDKMQELEKEIK